MSKIVLTVDDSRTMRDMLRLALTDASFTVVQGVRRSQRHGAVPILVLTTENDQDKKQRARSAGATGWSVKPFDPVKLVDAVRRVAA